MNQFIRHVAVFVALGAAALTPSGPAVAQNAVFETYLAQEFDTPRQYNAPGGNEYTEAPMLAEMVAAGSLPPLAERMPSVPAVVVPRDEVGRHGGTIVMHMQSDALWWLTSSRIGYANLVRQQAGNSGTYEPDLVERWETSDDQTIWTFYIRENLRWSDGEPFNADDLMFWYEHVLQNTELLASPPPFWRPGGQLVEMEALDDLTVQMTFAQPHPLFLLGLTEQEMMSTNDWDQIMNHPEHYMRQFHPAFVDQAELDAMVAERNLGSWVDLYISEVEPHTASPGRPYLTPWAPTGPISAEGEWTWERNPYYYKVDEQGLQLPYLDGIEISRIGDDEALVLATIGGELDVVTTFLRGDSLPTIFDAVNNRGAPLQVIPNINAKTGEVAIYINYTTTDPVLREIFSDVRFRQAVSLGINREEVSEARFRGFSQPTQASYSQLDPYLYNEEWATAFIEYDPARANELLDEMGLANRDGQGFRMRPDGERLTIIMDYRAGNHEAAVALIPGYMEDLGIELINRSSASALYRERSTDNSVQWASFSMEPSFFSLWALLPGGHSSQAFRPWGVEWSNWYYTGGTSGEEPPEDMRRLMQLVDLAETAGSIEERVAYLAEAGELHRENLWVIGVAGMDLRPHVVHEDLRNIPPSPYGLNGNAGAHMQYPEQWFWDR